MRAGPAAPMPAVYWAGQVDHGAPREPAGQLHLSRALTAPSGCRTTDWWCGQRRRRSGGQCHLACCKLIRRVLGRGLDVASAQEPGRAGSIIWIFVTAKPCQDVLHVVWSIAAQRGADRAIWAY